MSRCHAIVPVCCRQESFSVAMNQDDDWLLVDAGFSPDEWLRFHRMHKLDPSRVRHVLLTHEHLDHVQGLRWWLQEYACRDVKIWAPEVTLKLLSLPSSLHKHLSPIEPSMRVVADGFLIECCPVTHDAHDPVAWKVTTDTESRAVVVDCGTANRHLVKMLRGCGEVFLSPYYEEQLMGPEDHRPPLQLRIASLHGHMSNHQVADLLRTLQPGSLERVILGHSHRRFNTRPFSLVAIAAALGSKVSLESWC